MSGTPHTPVAIAAALAAALALTGFASTATATTTTVTAGPPPAADEVLFDDFDYTGHDDPALGAHGWTVRSGSGGPGVPGATWAPENITFAKEGGAGGGNSVMTLRTATSGTAQSTEQAELHTQRMKFGYGTYAARVKFSDAPASGPDGDHVNQAFFAINELKAPMDKDYAEYDFEYLPNGGWGENGNILYTTSWDTFNPDPWEVVNQHTEERRSVAGWHDLAITIDATGITYYVDGRQFARHDPEYLPEKPMSIDFNQWLIDLEGQTGTEARGYDQQVDYVLHVKDQVLTPAQIKAAVEERRAAGTTFEDTVPAASPAARP
ncbi:glycosyl hydrolase family protein [Streptomyces piniterrae]|uniref:Glycosyl hydrolase family protein n=1 Tax=Streptomyces piniterrae TaxID=2571125 RepID=A0A4U0NSJ6_9ACTN|nr:glycosyl hydrolase family protein [Streptomyces piniterrae]